MSLKHYLLVIISLLAYYPTLQAQDPCDDFGTMFTFSAPYTMDSSPITPGSEFCVDVILSNSADLNSFQFVLSYNPNMLEIVTTPNDVQDILGPTFIMGIFDDIGYLSFTWFEGSGLGLVLPDQAIFKLTFRAIGNPGDCSFIGAVYDPIIGPTPQTSFSQGDIILPSIGCDLEFGDDLKIAIECEDFFGSAVACNAENAMAMITLTVCGGFLPYSYSVTGVNSGFQTGGIITNASEVIELIDLEADTYEISIEDLNGTIFTREIVIEDVAPLSFDLNVKKEIPCPNLPGTLEITNVAGGSGDFANYDIEWSNGTFNIDTIGVQAGDYSVTITDENGCTASRTTSLVADSIKLVNIVIDSSSCGGDDGRISFDIVGGVPDGAGNYEIKINNIPQAPGNSFSGGVDAGNIEIWVRDDVPCPADTFKLYIPTKGKLGVDIQTSDVLCNGDSTGSVMITLSERLGFISGLDCPPNTILDSDCGEIIRDENGDQLIGFTSTDNLGYNQNLWPRTYFITLVSESECRLDTFFTIGEPDILTAVKDSINPDCSVDGGAVTITPVGGTAPYDYQWSFDATASDSTYMGLMEGMYFVTVTDVNGCSIEESFNLEGGGMLTPIVDIIQEVNCDSTILGIVEVSLQSGSTNFQADWFALDGTLVGVQPRVEFLFPGTYYVELNDRDSGCMGSDTFEITQSARFIFDYTVTDADCFGGNNGVINIEEPTGGVSPYSFNWQDFGPIGPFAGNLDTGFYQVNISDFTGCSLDTTFYVGAPSIVTGDIDLTPSICYGGCTGTATATPSGGTITNGSYSYLWDTGETDATANNLCAGVHTVTIYDELGCESEEIKFRIEQPDSLQVQPVSVSSPSCADDSTGIILVEAGGGISGYMYDWGPGLPQDSLLLDLPSGTYTVTVTDQNDCTATSEFVLMSAEPVFGEVVIAEPVQCFGGTTCVSIDPNSLTGGSSGQYVYSITLADGTIPIDSCFEVIGGFEYTINIFDAVGGFLCSYETTILIDQPEQINITLGDDREMIIGDSTTFLTAMISGGVAIDTIIWSEDVNNGPNSIICMNPECTEVNILPNNTTVYTATMIDENGCESFASVLVEVLKERKVYRPNIFKPSSVNGNGRFMVFIGSGAEEIEEFGIYDRWGNQVFSLENVKKEDITPDIGWNGRINDVEADIGVYIYYALIKFPDEDEPILFKGDFTLVR